MELGIFDIVGAEVKITRPDRMVCSCREEVGYEVPGSGSMDFVPNHLVFFRLEGREP